jgi:tetratricopeptide (TPR) repeat protein
LAAPDDEPIFVQFLDPENPDDATLLDYWQRSLNEELEASAMVDLGTMLYFRGFPKDAERMYRRALKLDKGLYEGWFRLGLVLHGQGDFDSADQAYRRCLKKRPGHGWANFYLGLLEEQRGHGKSAMYHLETAFRHAPELANPAVNPAVLGSKLALGAKIVAYDAQKTRASLPLTFLEPAQVEKVRASYLPPEPEEVEEVRSEPVAAPAAAPAEPMDSAPSDITRSLWEVDTDPRAQAPTPTPVPQRPPRSIPVRRAPTPSFQEPPANDRERGTSSRSPAPPVVPIGNVSGEAAVLP